MSSLLSTFSCCFWWFLLGALLGWLLNKWLCKCTNKTQVEQTYTPPPPPAAKAADIPVAKAANIPAAKPAPVKAAAPKPAPKSKAKPAPKTAAFDLAAAKAAGFKIRKADDLTVIEGIGPKINELFKNAGLKTFVQVSGASVPQMRKILDDGGSRFRIANPSTWAQQAKLAAANKWPELKKLQDELSGGLKK